MNKFLAIAVLMSLVALSLRNFGDRYFFYPSDRVFDTAGIIGADIEEVDFESSDGTQLHGWWMPSKGSALGTVVYCHGNHGNVTNHARFVRWLPERGYNVFVFDYRGFGKSAGRPSRGGSVLDAEAAIDFALARDPTRTFVFGHSLGGAIGTVAASHRLAVRGLIAESTFHSYRAVAKMTVPKLRFLVPWLVSEGSDPASVLPTLHCPIFVAHGAKDRITPLPLGRQVYSAATMPKQLRVYPNAAHATPWLTYRGEFEEEICAFLASCLDGVPSADRVVASPSEEDDVAVDGGAELVVMTFNLRYASADGENAWPARRDLLVDTIRRSNPDILGTQEGLHHQLQEIDADLPDFARIGVGRRGGSHGEFMAIYYRSDRFRVDEYGDFWLSETPDLIGSKSYDADLPRMVTWAKLHDRDNDADYWIANTHFDHAHEASRVESAKQIVGWTKQLDASIPLVLMGDFNSERRKSAAYRTLVIDGPLRDAFDAIERGESFGTFHGFQGGKLKREPIDWILTRGSVRSLRSEIVTHHIGDQYPSDHYPVIAKLSIE